MAGARPGRAAGGERTREAGRGGERQQDRGGPRGPKPDQGTHGGAWEEGLTEEWETVVRRRSESLRLGGGEQEGVAAAAALARLPENEPKRRPVVSESLWKDEDGSCRTHAMGRTWEQKLSEWASVESGPRGVSQGGSREGRAESGGIRGAGDRVGVKERGGGGVRVAATAVPSRDHGRPWLFLLGPHSTTHVPSPQPHHLLPCPSVQPFDRVPAEGTWWG